MHELRTVGDAGPYNDAAVRMFYPNRIFTVGEAISLPHQTVRTNETAAPSPRIPPPGRHIFRRCGIECSVI